MIPLLLAACVRPVGGGVDRGPGPVVTSETGAGPTDSGAPPKSRTPVPPSVRILRPPDLYMGGYLALLPATATEPSVLFLDTTSEAPPYDVYGWPMAFAIAGDIPAGDHAILGLWDGVSGFHPSWPNTVVPAGDVDKDGHGDLWLGHQLYLGPFLGKRIDRGESGIGHYAALTGDLADPKYGWYPGEFVVAGDFDADGDGELDVITQVGDGMQGFLRYGPLVGSIPSAAFGLADPASYTSFGENQGCGPNHVNYRGTWLKDQLGPGHDAIAIGSDPTGSCNFDTFLWDPLQPRGSHLRYDQALASTGVFGTSMFDSGVYDAGDVDQDGHPDLVLSDDDEGLLVKGPPEGYIGWSTTTSPRTVENGRVVRAVGDMNGDGAPELIGLWVEEWTAEGYTGVYPGTWVVLFSPFPEPLDMTDGLPVAIWGVGSFGKHWADLDGDGLADLVDPDPDPNTIAAISIWYGKDLRAAWEARQATSD